MLHSPQQATGGGLESSWHRAEIFNIAFIQPAVRLLGKICSRLNVALTCSHDLLCLPLHRASYADLWEGDCRYQCPLCQPSLARRKKGGEREETRGLVWFPLLMVALPWVDKGRVSLFSKEQCFLRLGLLKSAETSTALCCNCRIILYFSLPSIYRSLSTAVNSLYSAQHSVCWKQLVKHFWRETSFH